jgi:hypothetical protein
LPWTQRLPFLLYSEIKLQDRSHMHAHSMLASNCNCACMSTYKSLNKVTF